MSWKSVGSSMGTDGRACTPVEQGGAPKAMEWFAALGLVVTLVWLYLELLRLLAKLNRR